MILTQELIDATSPCSDGYALSLQLGCALNMESEDAIQLLEASGYPQYANWVRSLYTNPIALKMMNCCTSIQYLVLDPVANVFVSTTVQSEVAAIKEQIIFANPDIDPSLIVAYEEITSSIDGKTHRFKL
jgi:hypothetical protein